MNNNLLLKRAKVIRVTSLILFFVAIPAFILWVVFMGKIMNDVSHNDTHRMYDFVDKLKDKAGSLFVLVLVLFLIAFPLGIVTFIYGILILTTPGEIDGKTATGILGLILFPFAWIPAIGLIRRLKEKEKEASEAHSHQNHY